MTRVASNRNDLSGREFGRLKVIGYSHTEKRRAHWLCLCSCGKQVTIKGAKLVNLYTRSCGCLKAESLARNLAAGHAKNTRHGYSGTPTYSSWSCAKARCFNKHDEHFADYGGRGIKMCGKWRNSFASFLSDMGERPTGTTLDRIDNDKGYEPGNCRWATPLEQARNRRSSVSINLFGEWLSVPEMVATVGVVNTATANARRRAGWKWSDAIWTPRGAEMGMTLNGEPLDHNMPLPF